MPLIFPSNTLSAGGFSVDNSCRFDGNAYLHKTQSGGNRKTWTMSCWTKFTGGMGSNGGMLMACDGLDDNTNFLFGIDNGGHSGSDTGTLSLHIYGADGFRTTPVLRDYSAWYHVVLASDTTQAVSTNRLKLYVNNVQITLDEQGDYPAQDQDLGVNNSGTVIGVGTHPGSVATYALNSYMAEFVLIDGLQLTPSSFGEANEDSPTIWQPIDVSGLTFGTNGFYLDFEDSANLGNDANGGTDLTEVSLAATDQSTDTSTLNMPTMNFLDAYWPTTGTSWAFSEGNLQVVSGTGASSANGYSYNNANFALSAGKWYWEVKPTNLGGSSFIGIISEGQIYNQNLNEILNSNAYAWTVRNSNGDIKNNNTTITYASSYTTDDIIGVALDLDNNKIYFSKNGDWGDGSGSWDSSTFDAAVGDVAITAPASTGNGHYFPTMGASDYSVSSTWQLNFGSAPYTISSGNADENDYGNFEYAVPSGFLAINSYNLGTAGG